MNIIVAKENHLDDICHINEVFSKNHEYDHPRDFILEQINSGKIYVYILEGKVVGYLLYQVLWGNTPFLALIKLLPKYQKSGIGTKLINYLEKSLIKKGFLNYISSTELINVGAQRFHESNKFEKIGNLDMVYGEEIFYKKSLKSK